MAHLELIQWRSLPNTVRVIQQQSTGGRRYRWAMEYARLETARLRDIDETYYYGAQCRSCLHASRLDLIKLRAHLGGTSG